MPDTTRIVTVVTQTFAADTFTQFAVPTPIQRAKCLAVLESPGDIFPPRCHQEYRHEGDHAARTCNGIGPLIRWANTDQ